MIQHCITERVSTDRVTLRNIFSVVQVDKVAKIQKLSLFIVFQI